MMVENKHQNGVISPGQSHGGYVTITFPQDKSKSERWIGIQRALSAVEKIRNMISYGTTEEIKKIIQDADITVGLGFEICQEFELNGFENGKMFPRSSKLYPYSGGDVFFHIKSNDMGVCVEIGRLLIKSLDSYVGNVEEVYSFTYIPAPTSEGRDLSGFIDGTENPKTNGIRSVTALTKGKGSYVLTQRWVHNKLHSYEKLSQSQQEKLIGRTKPDSVEMDPLPPCSHVAKTQILDDKGREIKIVRQSQPYVWGSERGLFFIAYAKSPKIFTDQLEKMAGVTHPGLDGVFQITTPATGAYFYCPSMEEIQTWSQSKSKI